MNGSDTERLGPAAGARWLPLLATAVLAMVPALAVSTLIEAMGTRTATIVNGRLVADATARTWTTVMLSATMDGRELRLDVPVLVALGWLVARTAADGLAGHGGGGWPGDAVWAGAGLAIEHLALVAMVPVQAMLLLPAYRSGTGAAATGATTSIVGRPVWWLAVGGLVSVVAVPAVVASTVVLVNPHRLPLATVAHHQSWLSSRPLAKDIDVTTVVDCADPGCVTSRIVGPGAWSAARLVVDRAGG